MLLSDIQSVYLETLGQSNRSWRKERQVRSFLRLNYGTIIKFNVRRNKNT